MNFQQIENQRKIILISSAVGIISVFLPWYTVSAMGFNNSINGFHGVGIIVFLAFAALIAISLMGNQSSKLDKKMWLISLIIGVLSFLFVIIKFGSSSDNLDGGFGLIDAGPGFGIWLALICSIGVIVGTWFLKNPSYNVKESFDLLTGKSSSNTTQ